VCNLAVSPFLLVFLLIYFFMKNAEKFYHHPSSVGGLTGCYLTVRLPAFGSVVVRLARLCLCALWPPSKPPASNHLLYSIYHRITS
jgi:hypothetical protein